MKTIIISIRSLWACKILNGDKKIEVRKGLALYNALKKAEERGEEVQFLMYVTKDPKRPLARFEFAEGARYEIYGKNTHYACGCSGNMSDNLNGKVVAKFKAKAEEIEQLEDCVFEPNNYQTMTLSMQELLHESRLEYKQLDDYLKGKEGTALHIEDLEIFDKPKELSEFFHGFKLKNNGAITFDRDSKALRQRTPYGYEYVYPLSHAPRSWCYVQEA